MAATNAKAGFGTLLKRGDGATPTEGFTIIPEVKDINGGALRQMFEDATHQESPGAFEEFVPTVRQVSDITFTCNMLPNDSVHAAMRSDILLGTKRNYRVSFNGTGKRLAFAAYMQEISNAAALKGLLTQDLSLKISGPVTLENDT